MDISVFLFVSFRDSSLLLRTFASLVSVADSQLVPLLSSCSSSSLSSSSERAVLERLQERRGAIDDRAREIDLREGLLQAAERKLDGRINELKEIESRVDAGARAEQADAERQLKMLVIMYESMKAKDAARVFDRLKLDVLVPIATTMKPARMSEILAAMSPEAAEKLTVALAMRGRDAGANAGGTAASAAPAGELPRLETATQRPRRQP